MIHPPYTWRLSIIRVTVESQLKQALSLCFWPWLGRTALQTLGRCRWSQRWHIYWSSGAMSCRLKASVLFILPSHLISKAMRHSQEVCNTSRSARQPCKSNFPTEENWMKCKAWRSSSPRNEICHHLLFLTSLRTHMTLFSSVETNRRNFEGNNI